MPLMRASSPPRPSSPQGYTNTNPGGSGNAHTPDPGSGNPKPNTSTNTNALNPATSIPIVRLDVDAVSDVLAAGLAAALVGHVLFLKGQVPLPVMQLARMAEKRGATGANEDRDSRRAARAVKNRTELLASFDTLASHLSTTFTALSTAFAGALDRGGVTEGVESESEKRAGRARAYLAILVGPSVGTAKAKVVFAVDGLEVKVWGERESEAEEGDGEEVGEESEEEGEEEEEEGKLEEAEDQEEEDEEEEEAEEEIEPATPPPLSPSPSPSPRPSPSPSPAPKPYMTHTQQQKTLFNAERLLSRTLAGADAHGYGLNSDLG
ncbi:hypothetical protein AX14_004206 [Amanita brunnescens Koide BX004]|nr:hypothetical protein AX14_004206 [Amanita brunnescens Koide BX004]